MPSTPAPPTRAALLGALGLAVVAVSSAALWIRMSHAGPLAVSFWRLVWASVALSPWTVRAALRTLPAQPRAVHRDLGLAGLCLALHFALWIASLAPSSPYATSVAASASLVALHPVLVALGAPWIAQRPVPSGARAGIAVALLGAAVIALGDAGRGRHHLAGDALAFGGAIAGAGYFLLGAKLRKTLGLAAYLGPVYGVAALCLGAMALAAGDPLWLPMREHALFAALAAGPMIVGHGLLNWALGYLPAWAVSAVILAEPIGSALLVLVVLGEVPPVSAGGGGAGGGGRARPRAARRAGRWTSRLTVCRPGAEGAWPAMGAAALLWHDRRCGDGVGHIGVPRWEDSDDEDDAMDGWGGAGVVGAWRVDRGPGGRLLHLQQRQRPALRGLLSVHRR
jgi:drug/metabolite transporter (DMT)-like permease